MSSDDSKICTTPYHISPHLPTTPITDKHHSQLLVAILDACDIKFTSDDHIKIAVKLGGNVTGNAIRQRIAKIRKNGPAILASTAASTANTPGKKPAGNGAATSPGKKARTPKSSALLGPLLSEDDEEDETTPGAKENKKAGAEGGSGRASKKRSKPEGEEGEGEGDDVALPGTPTKKVKTEEAVEEAGAGTEEADEDVDIRSFFDIDAAGAEDPGDAV